MADTPNRIRYVAGSVLNLLDSGLDSNLDLLGCLDVVERILQFICGALKLGFCRGSCCWDVFEHDQSFEVMTLCAQTVFDAKKRQINS